MPLSEKERTAALIHISFELVANGQYTTRPLTHLGILKQLEPTRTYIRPC